MPTEQLTLRRAGDVRDEAMRRMGSTLARFGPSPQVPSPNLKKVYAELESGKLSALVALAGKIENGDATGSEEEQELVYDALPILVAYVQDLADMCRRRETALAECDVGIGA